MGIANTQLSDGTYIFGGTANSKPPYAVTASSISGQPMTIAYNGNQQSSQVLVGRTATVSTLIPGSSIFQPTIGGSTVYSGSTGAGPGTIADTASGNGTLLVQHTSTIYSGSSGVAPGAPRPLRVTRCLGRRASILC